MNITPPSDKARDHVAEDSQLQIGYLNRDFSAEKGNVSAVQIAEHRDQLVQLRRISIIMKRMQEIVDDDRDGGLGQGQSDIPFTQASDPREYQLHVTLWVSSST